MSAPIPPSNRITHVKQIARKTLIQQTRERGTPQDPFGFLTASTPAGAKRNRVSFGPGVDFASEEEEEKSEVDEETKEVSIAATTPLSADDNEPCSSDRDNEPRSDWNPKEVITIEDSEEEKEEEEDDINRSFVSAADTSEGEEIEEDAKEEEPNASIIEKNGETVVSLLHMECPKEKDTKPWAPGIGLEMIRKGKDRLKHYILIYSVSQPYMYVKEEEELIKILTGFFQEVEDYGLVAVGIVWLIGWMEWLVDIFVEG